MSTDYDRLMATYQARVRTLHDRLVQHLMEQGQGETTGIPGRRNVQSSGVCWREK